MNIIQGHVKEFVGLNFADQERSIIDDTMNKNRDCKVIQDLDDSANRDDCRTIFDSNF